MNFEKDLYAYLTTHADTTTLRGLVSTRIYWLNAPQRPTFPFILISVIDADPGFILDGDDGHQTTTLQVSLMGPDHSALVTIREELRKLLHGQRITQDSTEIKSSRLVAVDEFWVDDTPSGYVHMPCDFRFIHN